MNLYEYQWLRSFIDLGPNLSDSRFLNVFSSITNGPIEAKWHVAPPRVGGTKAYTNGLSHMTKMAAMSVYGKNLSKYLLCNTNADDLETWYLALNFWILPNLFKWCPWVDRDLFYGKVKFGPLCFCTGKVKTMDFSETVVVYGINVGRCSQLHVCMNLYEYQRSRSFIDPDPK